MSAIAIDERVPENIQQLGQEQTLFFQLLCTQPRTYYHCKCNPMEIPGGQLARLEAQTNPATLPHHQEKGNGALDHWPSDIHTTHYSYWEPMSSCCLEFGRMQKKYNFRGMIVGRAERTEPLSIA